MLLEVNVHRNWLHIVEWVLLIKWDAKVSFVFHLGPWDVLLNWVWIVLAGADRYGWILLNHIASKLKTTVF